MLSYRQNVFESILSFAVLNLIMRAVVFIF